jgi:hypothetical protein
MFACLHIESLRRPSTHLEERKELIARPCRAERKSNGAQATDRAETENNIVRLELIHQKVNGVEGALLGGRRRHFGACLLSTLEDERTKDAQDESREGAGTGDGGERESWGSGPCVQVLETEGDADV